MSLNKKGFTIVELVITISILAISSTIGLISFSEYQKLARDSVRVTDIKTLKSALQINYVHLNRYPDPSNYVERKYNGITVIKEGIIGKSVIENLSSISTISVDPTFKVNYNYSVGGENRTYEIGSIFESK